MKYRPKHEFSDNIDFAVYALAFTAIMGLNLGSGKVAESMYPTEEAAHFLDESGYTDIDHIDTDIFLTGLRGCGKGDGVKHEFTATGLNGDSVEVLVCDGIMKGATIRQG